MGESIDQPPLTPSAEEARLREQLSLLEAIADRATEALFVKDAAGRYLYVNAAAARTLGHPVTAILGRSDFDLQPAAVAQRLRENDQRIMATGQPETVEEEVREAGTLHIVQARKSPHWDETGQVIGLFGAARDVTARRQAEEALRRQTEETALLVETGQRIGQTLDLTAVYDTFREVIDRAMDCDGLLVSEYDADKGTIACRYAWVEGQRLDASAFPVLPFEPEGGGLQSRVLRTSESISIGDFAAHARAHRALYYANPDGSISDEPDPENPPTQSLLMVPVRLEGSVLGVVQVQSHQRNAYSAEQLRLLEAMTLQVAAASRNAYLFQQLQMAAARERAFLRDMLASVTEGRLLLCDSRDDLPAPLPPVGEPVMVTNEHRLPVLRHRVRQAAAQLGFPEERTQDVETAAGEAAMNALIHAGGGTVQVGASPGGSVVQVRIDDQGSGIAVEQIPRATLEKGYTTAGTMGHGFKLMLEMASRLWLLTGPEGTTVVLEQDRTPLPPPWLRDEATGPPDART